MSLVLECAWVRKNSSGNLEVYATTSAGLGFELDRDNPSGSRFHVRECSGCPDAVVLNPGDANTPPTVGVVYPHQTNFGDPGTSNDGTRLFELRFLTCSINPSTFAISSTSYPALIASNGSSTGLVYDGAADAAGIVLPDLAPGGANWRFGLAFEEQIVSGSVTNGRILLQNWEVDPTGPGLTQLESHAFGSASSTAYRRRPMISSYPSAFPGEDVFAIAFNRKTPTSDGDVIYEEWNLTDGATRLVWTVGWGWDQNGNDVKPVPLLGRELSNLVYLGRCYAERAAGGVSCDLLNYARKDTGNDDDWITIQTADHLQRPAASYVYLGGDDTVALTWEQETSWTEGGNSHTAVQIWLRME